MDHDIRVEFRKLDVKAGDTLLCRTPPMDSHEREWLSDVLSEELSRVTGDPSPTLLIVDNDTEISLLPEDEMRAAGWVRKCVGGDA